jgi:hypothetical protein
MSRPVSLADPARGIEAHTDALETARLAVGQASDGARQQGAHLEGGDAVDLCRSRMRFVQQLRRQHRPALVGVGPMQRDAVEARGLARHDERAERDALIAEDDGQQRHVDAQPVGG